MFLLVGSCATPYQAVGFAGGYSDTQIGRNTFLVSFRGNAYTSAQQAYEFLLYRCAELMIQNDFDYFIVSDRSTDTSRQVTTVDSSGRYATTRAKPRVEATIQAFSGEKPAGNPDAFDARETMQYLGPKVGRPVPLVTVRATPPPERPVQPALPPAGRWKSSAETDQKAIYGEHGNVTIRFQFLGAFDPSGRQVGDAQTEWTTVDADLQAGRIAALYGADGERVEMHDCIVETDLHATCRASEGEISLVLEIDARDLRRKVSQ
jgi:hypothetical protein